MTPWLSPNEIDDLCAPLKQHAAQIRFIRGLGITVREKPNGAALVMRAHFEEKMSPAGKVRQQTKTGPNRAALSLAYSRG
ncbi:MAG: hypothetical protein HKM00_09680 [Gallionella sp.]|nr:hypothetical protein [Gallionella sp.]